MAKIVSSRPLEAEDGCFLHSIEVRGGPEDGESWRQFKVTLDDGTVTSFWKQMGKPKFYKQVFVPWDFEHPAITIPGKAKKHARGTKKT